MTRLLARLVEMETSLDLALPYINLLHQGYQENLSGSAHPPVVQAEVEGGVAELGGQSSPVDIVGLVVVTRLAGLGPPPQSPVLRGSVSRISISPQHSPVSLSSHTSYLAATSVIKILKH